MARRHARHRKRRRLRRQLRRRTSRTGQPKGRHLDRTGKRHGRRRTRHVIRYRSKGRGVYREALKLVLTRRRRNYHQYNDQNRNTRGGNHQRKRRVQSGGIRAGRHHVRRWDHRCHLSGTGRHDHLSMTFRLERTRLVAGKGNGGTRYRVQRSTMDLGLLRVLRTCPGATRRMETGRGTNCRVDNGHQ